MSKKNNHPGIPWENHIMRKFGRSLRADIVESYCAFYKARKLAIRARVQEEGIELPPISLN